MAAMRAGRRSISVASGVSPSSPSISALWLPWPRPVAANEPYSRTRTPVTRARSPEDCSASTNCRAARIGPTVWELEGPIPIVKRSKTLTAIAARPLLVISLRPASDLVAAAARLCFSHGPAPLCYAG